jgi:DNA-binding beta-propeller fold protein YncE
MRSPSRQTRPARLIRPAVVAIVLASGLALGNCSSSSDPDPSPIAPKHSYLYVANNAGNSLSAYSIGQDGALTALSSGTAATGEEPFGIAIRPDGDYLYAANVRGHNLSAYSIGQDGALSALTPGTFASSSYPCSIAISPDGAYLYATTGGRAVGANDLSAYTIGSDGALTAITAGTFSTGADPYGIAISPDGAYLYVANVGSGGSNGLSAYSIGAGGALTAITSGTFATGLQPNCIAISPDRKYLYLTNNAGDTLSAYSIGSGGALAALPTPTYPTGAWPIGIAISPNGAYLYVTNYGSAAGANGLSAYSIGSGGALTPITTGTFTTGSNPSWIAISPDGAYLYVTNHGSSDGIGGISAYSIGPGGALTAITSGTFNTGWTPAGIAIVTK